MADVDSIRRMAYFYVEHGQPVPFDIVLLGEMLVTRGRGGELTVEVPAVGKRKLREGETLPDYVLRATDQTVGHVGGYCPWLGLGWDHIGMVRPEARALVEGLQVYAHGISREGFTVFDEDTGHQLIKRWGLSSADSNQPADG